MRRTITGTALACACLLAMGPAAHAQTTSSGTAQTHQSNTPTAHQGNTTTATARSSRANADSALARLQDARVTLARLAERSMPQDAREALGPLTTAFDALYRQYTGHAPNDSKSALQAATAQQPAQAAVPAANWQMSYDAVRAALADLTPAAKGSNGAAGKTGSAVGTSGKQTGSLPAPARDDVRMLQSQLEQFHRAATGHTPQK